jgi:hypothetical protein
MTASTPTEAWGEHLRALRRPLPSGLVERAQTASAGPAARAVRRRRVPTAGVIVAVVAVALVINAAAVYFLPTYASALGHVPGAGALIQWSGLGASDVDVVYATSAHDGVRLTVTAAFADENHTLLTVEIDGPTNPGFFNSLALTDQFGHSYSQQGFSAIPGVVLPDDATPVDYLDFAPISGPAAGVGARLTLTAEDWTATCFCDVKPVSGTWQVTFVLTPRSATVVRWAPGRVNGLRYTFPSVTVTDSKLVEIVMDAQGSTLPASGFSGPGVQVIPAPRLLDAKGEVVSEARVPWISLNAEGDNQSQDLDYMLQPGRYRLFVYGLNGSSIERDLVIG